jgi:hypothetical protein
VKLRHGALQIYITPHTHTFHTENKGVHGATAAFELSHYALDVVIVVVVLYRESDKAEGITQHNILHFDIPIYIPLDTSHTHLVIITPFAYLGNIEMVPPILA